MNRKRLQFLAIQCVNGKVKLIDSNGFLLFHVLLEVKPYILSLPIIYLSYPYYYSDTLVPAPTRRQVALRR